MTDEERKPATEKMAVRIEARDEHPLYGNPYPTAMDRAMRDIQEQERRIAPYGRLNPGAAELDRIRRLTDPLVG